MHGVPKDLPLHHFVGDRLTQIGISEYELHFHFQDAGSILVLGDWELTDLGKQLLDRSMEHKDREAYKVHLLLGQSVSQFSVSPPRSFTLRFTSGHNLTVFDDSEQYESFSVQPKGFPSVYI